MLAPVATLVAAGCLVAAPLAGARPSTTVDRTIQDRDRDNTLEYAPGESHVVRDDLGTTTSNRRRTRRSLLFFGQLTDKHVIDEESPARVEFLDRFGPPFTSAYRPQEGISPQVVDTMVQQMRDSVSPTSGRRLQLVMTTGDNSDNTQLNETRWFIDLLDGGVKVDPNSGIPGTCGTTPGHLYDGVRGDREYWEPDSSNGEDGPGYSPDEAQNMAEAQRSSEVRDRPGVFEHMNKPFEATGLGVPWYGIFGNHDALLQGNQPRNPAFEAIAVGCAKPSNLSASALAQVQALAAGGVTSAEQSRIYSIALADMAAGEGSSVNVPLDPKRRPLKKSEYIQEHFRTNGTPVGHGFTPENVATGMGNYSFSPKPGLRFIVLDTIAENGGDGGNIDDAQFRWIHEELLKAEQTRELAVTFAHHSLRTMEQPPISPFPPGDQGGNPDPNVHFGGADDSECPTADPATPPPPGETLRCLYLRHPSVIAFVNGHEHQNRVTPFERRHGAGRAVGGFWEINTAAHIDWPEQSRTLDLVDNRDGSLSLFGTILDHAAAPDPGPGSSASVRKLASISRELSYNDPDASNGEDGHPDARGGREDRNVELIVRNPYAK